MKMFGLGSSAPVAKVTPADATAERVLGSGATQRRHYRSAGAALICAGLFAAISREVLRSAGDSRLTALDARLLRAANDLRRPLLNGVAVDFTALGSPTLLTLTVGVALGTLARRRDRAGAALVGLGVVGALIGSVAVKALAERDRPDVIPRLVAVSSTSYPSGHAVATASIFLAIAIAFTRRDERTWVRNTANAAGIGVALLVGASRVYLGVHYPTDVMAGSLFGFGWTLVCASLADYLLARRARRAAA